MVLFVDMDEVLADTYGAHIEQYNQDFGENLTKEFCSGWEVWQKVPENRRQSIRRHTSLKGFFRNLNVIPDSQTVMRELAQKYEVYVASAAMEFPNSLEEKSEWLDEHFPFIPWQQRILCGHKHILNGDILIDDRTRNLETFQGRSIMFSSPHNIHTNGFERANDWKEVGKKLL